jgi:predicted TIM-barrel fold metal-dependent hydrolase
VNPEDPERAVHEVERWAGHRDMVQVAVPLEAHRPYGHRGYRRLWEAVAEAGFPVAVQADGGAGTDFAPTPNGYPRHHIEYMALYPVNFIYHLSSLIAEGVFDRVPGLRFVFGDGGHDVLTPLMWRMDVDWPISRVETPWVSRRPTEYLADAVRFVSSRLEDPPGELAPEWYEMTSAADLVMYGSNHPRWTEQRPAAAFPALGEEERRRILGGNAVRFYDRLSGRVE